MKQSTINIHHANVDAFRALERRLNQIANPLFLSASGICASCAYPRREVVRQHTHDFSFIELLHEATWQALNYAPTNDVVFPIPHPSKTPRDAYNDTFLLNQPFTRYGRNRKKVARQAAKIIRQHIDAYEAHPFKEDRHHG